VKGSGALFPVMSRKKKVATQRRSKELRKGVEGNREKKKEKKTCIQTKKGREILIWDEGDGRGRKGGRESIR